VGEHLVEALLRALDEPAARDAGGRQSPVGDASLGHGPVGDAPHGHFGLLARVSFGLGPWTVVGDLDGDLAAVSVVEDRDPFAWFPLGRLAATC
jgi:hypothetical protein